MQLVFLFFSFVVNKVQRENGRYGDKWKLPIVLLIFEIMKQIDET